MELASERVLPGNESRDGAYFMHGREVEFAQFHVLPLRGGQTNAYTFASAASCFGATLPGKENRSRRPFQVHYLRASPCCPIPSDSGSVNNNCIHPELLRSSP